MSLRRGFGHVDICVLEASVISVLLNFTVNKFGSFASGQFMG